MQTLKTNEVMIKILPKQFRVHTHFWLRRFNLREKLLGYFVSERRLSDYTVNPHHTPGCWSRVAVCNRVVGENTYAFPSEGLELK